MSEIEQRPLSAMDRAAQMAELTDLWNNPEAYGAGVIDEGQLEKEKVRLLGVPHVITRVTYQSDFKKSDRGYVTIEGMIAPQSVLNEAIDRGWIPDIALPLLYKPGEVIKYNDGSTGIRRQITKILYEAGLVNVGELDPAIVKENPAMSPFDKPWADWFSFNQTSKQNGPDGEKIDVPDITFGPNGRPLRIIVAHGLRVSHMDDWDTDVFYLS